MSIPEIVIIAVALSMDAFAISITLGLSVEKHSQYLLFIPPLYFGFFQAIMPLIGYFGGYYFTEKINGIEHWIAFALLGLIGAKMIIDSFKKDDDKKEGNPFRFIKMLLLAIATSIDALAVGVTFAFFRINIYFAIIITGLMTFGISLGGMKIGNIIGAKFKSKAEIAGGVILIVLGLRILISHLFFG